MHQHPSTEQDPAGCPLCCISGLEQLLTANLWNIKKLYLYQAEDSYRFKLKQGQVLASRELFLVLVNQQALIYVRDASQKRVATSYFISFIYLKKTLIITVNVPLLANMLIFNCSSLARCSITT